MVSMKKQAIMLLEEEVMLSAAAYFQIMKKEKPARKKKSIYLDEKQVAAQSVVWAVWEAGGKTQKWRHKELQKLHCSTKPKRKTKTGQNRT